LRPDYALAHLNYGLMLRNKGRIDEARRHIRQAAGSSDASVRQVAQALLSDLGTQ
jgi:hypothetical protein